jgi:SAM-dependent methyltransferase
VTGSRPSGAAAAAYWERTYAEKRREEMSWHEESPDASARLVLAHGVPGSVVDVGAGASTLPDVLLEAGVGHVTLVDLSLSALAYTQERLGLHASRCETVVGDLLSWRPDRAYDVWHDRAVFHFLTTPDERAAYGRVLREAIAPGGHVVIAAFAEDGPEECSGLPVTRWSPEALATEMGEGFTTLTAERVEHRTPWDTVQPFTYLVLRRDS